MAGFNYSSAYCIVGDGRVYIAGYDSHITVVTFSVLCRYFVDRVSLSAS